MNRVHHCNTTPFGARESLAGARATPHSPTHHSRSTTRRRIPHDIAMVSTPSTPQATSIERRAESRSPPSPLAERGDILNLTRARSNSSTPRPKERARAPHASSSDDKENVSRERNARAKSSAVLAPIKEEMPRVAYVSASMARLELREDANDGANDDDDEEEEEEEEEEEDVPTNITPNVGGARAVLFDIELALEKDAMPLRERLAMIRAADVHALREMFELAFGKPTKGKNMDWLRHCLRMRFRAIAAHASGARVKFKSTKATAKFVICDERGVAIDDDEPPPKPRKRKICDEEDPAIDVNALRVNANGLKHTWIACPFAGKSSAPSNAAMCSNCAALSLLFEPKEDVATSP